MSTTVVHLDLGDGIRCSVKVPYNYNMCQADLKSLALHKLKCVVKKQSNPINMLSKSLKVLESEADSLKMDSVV